MKRPTTYIINISPNGSLSNPNLYSAVLKYILKVLEVIAFFILGLHVTEGSRED